MIRSKPFRRSQPRSWPPPRRRSPRLPARPPIDVGVAPCSLDSLPACEPAQDFAVTTDGALAAEVVAVCRQLHGD